MSKRFDESTVIPIPCKDYPRRTADCHATCKDYALFREWQEWRREQRYSKMPVVTYAVETTFKRKRVYMKKVNRYYKGK